MAMEDKILGLFAGLENMRGLTESDRELLGEKSVSLPALIREIEKYWNNNGSFAGISGEAFRGLYEVLAVSGSPLAPFEELNSLLGDGADAGEGSVVTRDDLNIWAAELDSLSPRVPGTESMDETARYLKRELESFGLEAWTEPLNFKGVFFRKWSFEILGESGRAFTCFPQNNVGFADVTAELVYVGRGFEDDYDGKDVRGKIVFLDWGDIWDHEGPCAIHERYGLLRLYDIAYAHGAAAMVGFFTDTPGNALKLIEPGIKPTGGSNVWGQSEVGADHGFKLPALNIGKQDATEILKLVERGSVKARLVIDGVRKVSTTQSVIGFLPGQSNHTIACAAHSCTAFEGAVCDTVGVTGVLGLAKHFAALPIEKRPKSMLFFFDSFHVWGNCCQTANLILKNHPTLAQEIDAFLWLDHISDGGMNTPHSMYTSENPTVFPLAALAMAKRGLKPLALPVGRTYVVCASGAFERRGIPIVNLQAFNDYVLTTEDTWDRFDLAAVYRSFLIYLDIASALQLSVVSAGTPGEPIGGCGSLFTETDMPEYPTGESYAPEPAYPLYIGGEAGPVTILKTYAEKASEISRRCGVEISSERASKVFQRDFQREE